MYLAIDTSSDNAGLALIEQGVMLAEDTWHCHQNHSVELLPRMVKLLQSTGASIHGVKGIIIARGPGSYNGLRVGLGTAKGLTFGLDVPIAGISTLSAAAYRYAGLGLPVCAVMPAGRDEIAWAIYRQTGNEWQNLLPETVSAIANVFPFITDKTIITGEPSSAIAEIKTAMGDLAVMRWNLPCHRLPPWLNWGLHASCAVTLTTQPPFSRSTCAGLP